MKHVLAKTLVIGILVAGLSACAGRSAQVCDTFKFSNESGKYISFTLTYKPSRTTFIDLFSRPRPTTSYITGTDTFLHAYDVYGTVNALDVTLNDSAQATATKPVNLKGRNIKACTYKASIDNDGIVALTPLK